MSLLLLSDHTRNTLRFTDFGSRFLFYDDAVAGKIEADGALCNLLLTLVAT